MTEIISLERGDDEVWELTVTEKKAPYASVDIMDCTIKLTVRATWKGVIFLQKTFTLTDPMNGKAEVAIDAADTSGLTNEKHEYVFDVEITTSMGKVETLCKGNFLVLPEATYT